MASEPATVRARKSNRPILVLLAAFLTAWVLLPGKAQADHLDAELMKLSKKIMEDLRKHGVKNVGVLKFKMESTGTKGIRNTNLLTVNLANRLENALILGADPKAPIGITRGAGYLAAKAAAAKQAGSPETIEGRKSLFKLSYPLAWGNEKVQVDAFLTGTIQVSKDLKTTTLNIKAFDKKDPAKLRPVASCSAKTDRAMLVDLGQSFVVKRSTGTSEEETLDNEATDNANNQDRTNNNGGSTNNSLSDLLDFKIYFGDQPVDFTADPSSGGEGLTQREPREGESVYFTFQRKTDKKLAVALLVNGQNTTIDEEENADPKTCTKWVLVDANTLYRVDGFYSRDGKSVKKFKVLSDDESKQSALNPETKGLITLVVFEEGTSSDGGDLITSRSLRGNKRPYAKKPGSSWPTSLADARKQLLAGLKPVTNLGLIVGGDNGQANVQSATFNNPLLKASLTIRYYPKDQ